MPTKVRLVKAMVFPVVMYGCESWTVKKAECPVKCSLGISNFLEVISSLSHSVVFLYFFALIAEEGFLLSSC